MPKFTNFDLKLDVEKIMMLMDCPKHHNLYDDMVEEFAEIAEIVEKSVFPMLFTEFGEIPNDDEMYGELAGKKALFAITSIGRELSDLSTKAFAENDYVKGMMYDSAADFYLYEVGKFTQKEVFNLCKEKGYGVEQSYEAPHKIPMNINKVAFDLTKVGESDNFSITEGFMLDPVKSGTMIYLLGNDTKKFNVCHDCFECSSVDSCRLRMLTFNKIVVKDDLGENKWFLLKKDTSLYKGLIDNKFYIEAPCGGNGTCGKCEITLLKGEITPSKSDLEFYSTKEIDEGKRLSCTAFANGDCTIYLGKKAEMEVLSHSDNHSVSTKNTDNPVAIAIDLGTTTIAMTMVDLKEKSVVDTFTTVNSQRTFGADVISRIKSSEEGNLEKMSQLIRDDLSKGIATLLKGNNERVKKIILAGNTTMIHLLMGYSCKSLGEMPFISDHLDSIKISAKEIHSQELFSLEINCDLIIFPGISAYVGGDIVSGMLACGFAEKDDISVIIDLGTNGEIAIGNKEKIMTSSTAAGPAFEAANITCGTASIEGAIFKCKINSAENIELETIGGKPPVGICGTGVIEITSELVRNELIDETGLLEEDYFDDGIILVKNTQGDDIVFTQKDIREIQLAKSAIRAGLETLINAYGVSYDDISKVFLAGGFGHKLDKNSAANIGLFPKEILPKIEVVGNSSLDGCIHFSIDEELEEKINLIKEISLNVDLSKSSDFNDKFMEYIEF